MKSLAICRVKLASFSLTLWVAQSTISCNIYTFLIALVLAHHVVITEMNFYECGEPMLHCPFHPLEDIVGICASCLRQRLHHLKAKIELERGSSWENFPTPESDYSCGQLHENTADHKSNIISDHHNNCALESHEIIARAKSMWMAKSTGQKKERRIRFLALRSFYHRLHVFRKNKDINRDPRLSHEDSFISIKLEGNERNPSWISTMIPSAKSCESNSSRNSVSELGRRSWDGIIFKRSMSYQAKDGMKTDHGTLGDVENHRCSARQLQRWRGCSYEYEQQGARSSDSSHSVGWRTRVNEMFRMKWRMRDSINSKKKTAKQVGRVKDPNSQFLAPKIWSLSTLSYHERDRQCNNIQAPTKPKQNKSWIRTLTSPKWSVH